MWRTETLGGRNRDWQTRVQLCELGMLPWVCDLEFEKGGVGSKLRGSTIQGVHASEVTGNGLMSVLYYSCCLCVR